MRLPLFLLTLTGCTSGMYESTSVEQQGACVVLEGRTFASGGDQLAFATGDATTTEITWSHAGNVEVGRATCRDQTVVATIGARMITATFDPATQRLVWSGTTYVSP